MADSKNFYLPVARALSQTVVIRERLLPRAGEAAVQADDHVEPADVVARAYVPIQPIVYNVAQALKVPANSVRGLLLKKEGDAFQTDEVIARRRRFLRDPLACRARAPGRLLAEHLGEVLLESAPVPLELQANIRGTVANASRFGVVLQTLGALVQGVWGNGKESYGVLKVLGSAREQPLTADLIDVSCLGMIVVVGGAIEPEGLRQAETQQVRGIIAGSMPSAMREQTLAMPFPVVLTEGFGSLAMAEPAYQLLRGLTGREVSLRAVSQVRWGAQRPGAVVPLSTREAPSAETAPAYATLRSGSAVRVCAGESMGQTGRVISESPQTHVFPSGMRARAVEVELADHEMVWAPINNLEAIA